MHPDISLIGSVKHTETQEPLRLYCYQDRYWLLPDKTDPGPDLFISPLSFTPFVMPGFYRHFKGGLYVVVWVAEAVNGETAVIYHAVGDSTMYARPQEMFEGEVTLPSGAQIKRFTNLISPCVPHSKLST